MIFIDTNYFLRFFLADNHKQSKKVKELFVSAAEGKSKIFTSNIVIFEIFWVLSSYYRKNKSEIISTLEKILALEFIEVDDRAVFVRALTLFQKRSLSLEDCYHLSFASFKKAKSFATFDQKLLKAWQKISD